MYTITISGFTSKEDVLSWVSQYEGGLEQHFEGCTSNTHMRSYIEEKNKFETDEEKTNFNLKLDPYV